MSNMISVIVPYAEDQTYLIRCINSVIRQTYSDIEIILITTNVETKTDLLERYPISFVKIENGSPYAGINEAIQRCSGEYIFFCNMTSVPATNTFLALLTHAVENQGSLWTGRVFSPPEKGCMYAEKMPLSWCGKLFKRDVITENKIVVQEFSEIAEPLFISEYLKDFESYETDSEVYIYESSEILSNIKWQDGDDENWNTMLLNISQLKPSIMHEMVHTLLKFIEKNKIESDVLIWQVKQYLHNCFELNFVTAKPILQQWWLAATENRDEGKLELVKKYLSKYEGVPDFLNLLLGTIGLSYRQYPYLSYDNLDDILYLLEISSQSMEENPEIKKIILSMQKELKEITELKENITAQAISSKIDFGETEKDLAGTHILNLEDHIIKECREGRVGFRTIMKFFKGWAAFKFHG